MEYLARKISRAKWEIKPFMREEEIGADATTSCLRAGGNKVSFWQCRSETNDIEEVLLALATPMEKPEAIDIVWLKFDTLTHDGFVLEKSEGQTPVEDLRDRHVDVIELTCKRLCRLGEHIAKEVRLTGNCHRFSRRNVTDIICQGVRSRRVPLGSLHDKMQQEISKLFNGI